MSVRLGALLCLTGLAACSHNTNQPPAQDASYVTEPTQAATEPKMKPASFERSTPAPATTPAPAERSTAAKAPLNTDTKAPAPSVAKPSDKVSDKDKAQTSPPAAPAEASPDNTKVNERDRSSAALTPMDQGNGKTDLKITQQIRQAVMANGSLSFTAKNVKIITQGGKVTLRGPVKSDQERSDIEAAARKVAGVTDVDNQLEVKK